MTLVRHGRTAHNAAGRFQGWVDIPLDESGHAQARLLAARLAQHERPPTRLYTSDLCRARQTAAPIEEALHINAVVTPQLREMNIGTWEGLTFTEIAALDAAAFEAWPFQGGPDGESMDDVAWRVRAFYDALSLQAGEHVVIVSHGVTITALLCTLLGWNTREAWAERRGLHTNTAMTTLEVNVEGGVSCALLACDIHLETLRSSHI
ncbi:histidine phosphatase family protein [Deinococcus terrestris]|uniref:histidine phosphatase family protein n=1 Tax=Deinococcus terrestris TaxID=2651870 RepID=UPI0018833A62|nr:histidine phosphatase family protein [Deinococcus terrestris]